ncbi:MAG: pseudaminic acid biosynthesis-associated methylase [Alphaproteobacteria bacterium]
MSDETQVSRWRGAFGDAYIERNAVTEEKIQRIARAFTAMLAPMTGHPPQSVLEVGANVGHNLRALRRITPAELFAVEPNPRARDTLVADGVVPQSHVHDAVATALPFPDGRFDLVFTLTVLIHVPEHEILQACREIHRVSRRFILTAEYFAPKTQTVPYRGFDDMLFKRDYGSLWLDQFPDLEYVADGFFWKRTTGLDNVNWWLFRKP